MPVFEADEVEFSYGPIKVLDGLSLAVNESEIFGVLGANGAGKTTLMRLLIGLQKPSSGAVRVFGEPPSTRIAGRIGYMPQLSALYQELSVRQNVDFFARMYGLSRSAERREAVDRAIEWVDLTERQKDPLTKLSGGMRQRVSLAIALVHEPGAACAGRAHRRARPRAAGDVLGAVPQHGVRRRNPDHLQPHDGRRRALPPARLHPGWARRSPRHSRRAAGGRWETMPPSRTRSSTSSGRAGRQ